MKRFLTHTTFTPLEYIEGSGFQRVRKGKIGKIITYKTRKSVEAFCAKNRTVYVEEKHIFYR